MNLIIKSLLWVVCWTLMFLLTNNKVKDKVTAMLVFGIYAEIATLIFNHF